jgi:hypothetical protein
MKFNKLSVLIGQFRQFSTLTVLVSLGLAMGLLGCKEKQPRYYSEIAFKPNPVAAGPMSGGMGGGSMPPMNADLVDITVTWKLPESWRVKDSANAMRIGSFYIADSSLADNGTIDPKAVDVSVIQLGGEAGGLKANINRWMGQVGIKATPEEMDDLIKTAKRFKTQSGQAGLFIDLTDKLSGDMTQSKTIYAGIVTATKYSVFVKAMGERERVVKIKSQLKAFCESLTISGPEA